MTSLVLFPETYLDDLLIFLENADGQASQRAADTLNNVKEAVFGGLFNFDDQLSALLDPVLAAGEIATIEQGGDIFEFVFSLTTLTTGEFRDFAASAKARLAEIDAGGGLASLLDGVSGFEFPADMLLSSLRAGDRAVFDAALDNALDLVAGASAGRLFAEAAAEAAAALPGVGATVGGDGADVLKGGSGDDALLGFRGGDQIVGRAGDDDLFGGAGSDQLGGGAGRDVIDGGAGRDQVKGGGGADLLFGAGGRDQINGGGGGDELIGGAGRDQLNGGRGDDVLTVDRGFDILTGGAGSDLFSFDFLDGDGGRIRDFEQGRDEILLFDDDLFILGDIASAVITQRGDNVVITLDPASSPFEGLDFGRFRVVVENADAVDFDPADILF